MRVGLIVKIRIMANSDIKSFDILSGAPIDIGKKREQKIIGIKDKDIDHAFTSPFDIRI